MGSSEISSQPLKEDEKTPNVADEVKEKLFKSAMQGKWKDVADNYAQKKEVRKTQMTRDGHTLLHLAASSGVENNVTLLMACLKKEDGEYGPKILEIQNERGETALHIAAAVGMVHVCLAMARLCPNMVVNILNKRKETPLFTAVSHGQKKAFFALQSVVETRITPPPGVNREGLRSEGGDTILHNAIFAGHFDLALEIIKCYPDMRNAMNEKGESPLHFLANKPFAFKSGTRLSLFDSVIYHCIFVDKLKVKYPKYKKKFSENESIPNAKDFHDKNHRKLPNYRQACYNILSLLKNVFKNIETARTTDGDPESGVKARQNGTQNRLRYPKKCYRVVDFFKPVVQFLLIIIATGIAILGPWRVQVTRRKKQTNTYAQQIMDELVSQLKLWHFGKDGTRGNMPSTAVEITPPNVGDNISKQKPDGATPILVAAKKGVAEMVKKVLEDIPIAVFDLDQDEKNIVLLAAEYGHFHIYDHILKKGATRPLFGRVDKQGNSALHLAASFVHERRWSISGAAFQIQSEVKWYKYIEQSVGPGYFPHCNFKQETAQQIFANTHKELIKNAQKWLIGTSQSASVVAALVATVAYTSATTVPGGNKDDSGFPHFEGQPAFQVFIILSFIALCFSVTALVFFFSIVTSSFDELDFEIRLPTVLILGMFSLFVSIAANLVSFCAGHFYNINNKSRYSLYVFLIFPVKACFSTSQMSLYGNLLSAWLFSTLE